VDAAVATVTGMGAQLVRTVVSAASLARPGVAGALAASMCLGCSATSAELPPVAVAVTGDAVDGASTRGGLDSGQASATDTADGDGAMQQTDAADSAAFPAGYCAQTCATAPADSCLRNGFPPAGDCDAYCSKHVADWTPAVGQAFAACVAEEPLCFEKLDDCLLRKLYPDGATVPVSLTVTGLAAYTGKTLRVWHDPGKANPFGKDQIVTADQLTMTWDVPLKFLNSQGVLLLLYIDADADGQCEPAADLTHSGYATWLGDVRAPAFSLTVATGQMNDAAFVCDYVP
jgi:hypothetical protein